MQRKIHLKVRTWCRCQGSAGCITATIWPPSLSPNHLQPELKIRRGRSVPTKLLHLLDRALNPLPAPSRVPSFVRASCPKLPSSSGFRPELFPDGILARHSLRASRFRNLFDARIKIAAWKKEYGEEWASQQLRPQSPAEFVATIRRQSYRNDADFICLENISSVSHFRTTPTTG
jgi:hypothetical protein